MGWILGYCLGYIVTAVWLFVWYDKSGYGKGFDDMPREFIYGIAIIWVFLLPFMVLAGITNFLVDFIKKYTK